MWDDDSRFSAPDGEFAIELAVATDILFDSEGRPANPRPTLAALVAKRSFEEPLNTACSLCAVMLGAISPANSSCDRLTLADDLVSAALDDVWTVAPEVVARVSPFVRTLTITANTGLYVWSASSGLRPRAALFPKATAEDFLPLVLFTLGLSSVMADATEAQRAGDPIRTAVILHHDRMNSVE